MRRRPRSLIRMYIYLAVSCVSLGVVLTFLVVFGSVYLGVDISRHLWLLAIPVALPVLLNVLFIELYYRLKRR
ncbi:MAG: hypothetical protein ABIH70_04390 [Chloroflexota bacterium]